MCRRIQCVQCHKSTYAGCGKHVDQVLRGVPDDARCHCNDPEAAPLNRQSSVPQIAAPAA